MGMAGLEIEAHAVRRETSESGTKYTAPFTHDIQRQYQVPGFKVKVSRVRIT